MPREMTVPEQADAIRDEVYKAAYVLYCSAGAFEEVAHDLATRVANDTFQRINEDCAYPGLGWRNASSNDELAKVTI